MKIDKSTITLHPQYGVNASMGACVLCGDPTGQILFLGNSIEGEAPRLIINSIEPCESCRENYLGAGVLLVESEDGKSVTGRSLVIKNEAYSAMFDTPMPENKIALVQPNIFEKLLPLENNSPSKESPKEDVKTLEG